MTLHLSVINAALYAGRTSEIEDAFRALVGFPAEEKIEGATLRDLTSLIQRVSLALAGDDNVMPGDTFALLHDQHGDHLHNGTYAGGAEAVLANMSWWRAHLAASWGRRR